MSVVTATDIYVAVGGMMAQVESDLKVPRRDKQLLEGQRMGYLSVLHMLEDDFGVMRPLADFTEECEGHPAGPFDPMGETVYCDGSCKVAAQRER